MLQVQIQIHQKCTPRATYTSASGGQCVTTTTIAAPPCTTGTVDSSGNCVTRYKIHQKCTPPTTYTSASGGQCVTTTTIAAPPCTTGTVDSSGNCVTSNKYTRMYTTSYIYFGKRRPVCNNNHDSSTTMLRYVDSSGNCVTSTSTPACPQGVPYSTSTGKCEVKPTVVCPPGYAFDVKESSKQKCKKNQITEYKNIATSSNIFFYLNGLGKSFNLYLM